MSKTIARGAHVVTDTSRHNSRPIISVLDPSSLRESPLWESEVQESGSW